MRNKESDSARLGDPPAEESPFVARPSLREVGNTPDEPVSDLDDDDGLPSGLPASGLHIADDRILGDLVRGLADAVVIADANGSIAFWNAAATRLFGWGKEEALGKTLDLIIPDRQRARHWRAIGGRWPRGTRTTANACSRCPLCR